jgi:hypothetical protein
MSQHFSVSAGWIDTSIATLVSTHTEVITQFTHVLITSLDSSTDLRGLPAASELRESQPGVKLLGVGLVLPSSILADPRVSRRLFAGFDEVWCFHMEPTLAKPEELSIVAPCNFGIDDVPEDVADWMRRGGCALGLGDGIGMNYVFGDAQTASTFRFLSTMIL